MKYYDTESGSIISEKDLQAEFLTLAAAGGTDCKTFTEYVRACTGKHGSLIPVIECEKG